MQTWRCKKQLGKEHVSDEFHGQKNSSSSSGDGTKFDKQLLALGVGDGGQPSVQIKVENPDLQAIKAKAVVLASCKSALEKRAIESKDMVSKLRAKNDATLSSRVAEWEHALTKLDEFIGVCRDRISHVDMVDGSSDLTGVWASLATLCETGEAHADGSILSLKRMRTLL